MTPPVRETSVADREAGAFEPAVMHEQNPEDEHGNGGPNDNPGNLHPGRDGVQQKADYCSDPAWQRRLDDDRIRGRRVCLLKRRR